MNIKLATLSIISIASAVALSQPAHAEGARFDYAPNTWSADVVKPHRHYQSGPIPTVSSGAMPGKNVLGLDPVMLAKPAPVVAPIARMNVTPQLSFSNPVPKINPQIPAMLPTAYQGKWGKPIDPQAPVVASLPTPAQAPAVRPMQSTSKHVAGNLRPFRSTNSVHAVLHRPVGMTAGPAVAMPANYGNMGYTQGAFVPVQSGSRQSTSTAVSGVLIRKQQRH